MGDEDLLDGFGEDDLEGDASGLADGGSQGPDPKGETPKERKRFQDAQAALDVERKRGAKLEAELGKLRGGQEPVLEGREPARLVTDLELIEDWREAAWERYPQFKDYGIEIDAIGGNSRAEIRGAAANLVAFVEKVETRARNRVLAEYGLSSAGLGGGGEKVPDFGAMSDEDFLKFINKRG